MSSASVTQQRQRRFPSEVTAIPDVRLSGGWRLCSRSSQPDDAPEPQRHPILCPGDPLMAYLVQVWRGIPQSGGLGWVTYGTPRSRREAERLLFYAARIRPNYHHKLENVTP